MRRIIITQARMTSSRLPGKVLKQISGLSMLGWHLKQLQHAQLADKILVATTNNTTDDPLEEEARKYPVELYRGSENHVLSRYLEAATAQNAELIVRVTSDCPLIDPALIDACIQKQIETQANYVSNINPRSYPRGLDVEVFTMHALQAAFKGAAHERDKEHVTPFIRNHPQDFAQANVQQAPAFLQQGATQIPLEALRWTLDTQADFNFLEKLLGVLEKPTDKAIDWQTALDHLVKHPEWVKINQHIQQKT